MTRNRGRERKYLISLAAAAGLLTSLATCGAAVAADGPARRPPADHRQSLGAPAGARMALFRAAAREFGTPASLLLAISYNVSRWDRPGGPPSVDGGYGLMDLTAPAPSAPGARGLPGGAADRATPARTRYTLDEAAALLHVPARTLETDQRQNIRGAAAVLASYARRLDGGTLPATLGGWYGVVAEFGGGATAQAAGAYADAVFRTLRAGASLTTADGQFLRLAPAPGARPDRAALTRLALPAGPVAPASAPVDCPSTLNCVFTPAAYAQNNPKDPSDYGNYSTAKRPFGMLSPTGQTVSMKIKYIIIHDTEGSYDSTIATFQNPANYVSANYVIRSSDGAVTEMVRPHDVSWGAGDWYVNMHAINIENEGFAAEGSTWYTPAEYGACAALVRYLAARYHIPLNRQHILGHEDVPGPDDYYTAHQHWDPGPFWNWNHFMALAHGVSDAAERASGGSATRGTHHLVTIDPVWAVNKPPVMDCGAGTCTTLPAQPANFVYLRTGPGNGYPLISDKLLGAGTTIDSDWGDKATVGETFAVADQSSSWTAIWYGGHKAWFYNPPGAYQRGLYTGGVVVTPKAGLSSIPVYGAAYPEASAYPAQVTPESVTKLSYTVRAGQQYPVITTIPTDYYYTPTIDSSMPYDHTVISGATPYYQISFNHRRFFVQVGDVTVRKLS